MSPNTQQNYTSLLGGEEKTNYSIRREQIDETPFWAIGDDTRGWHIVVGNNRLTELEIETLEKVRDYIEQKKWQLITMLIAIFTEQYCKQLNNKDNE